MADANFKLGVLKLGCIGAAPLLDLLLDERADRDDLETRAFSSGAKLDPQSCEGATRDCIAFAPDLVVVVSPNAALPGPTQAREALSAAALPLIAVGDGPSKNAFYKKNAEGKKEKHVADGVGFVILPADPMIGARREFLDPSEMALFNSDVIKVLAASGVLRALQNELDNVIAQMKLGSQVELPQLTITAAKAVTAAGFANPYAAAKAFASLTIAESVAAVTTKACFAEQDPDKYIQMVAAGHEMLRSASVLADEARELEKANDCVLRTPHAADGSALKKEKLLEKPS
jgi:methylenetetrahydromethanopterin dehydrogenase